jgi:choline dehydrogenase-like flavoprotein
VRLLLNGNRRHPQGIGNSNDQLGRFYMGHISGKIASIKFQTPQQSTISGFVRDAEGVYCRHRLVIGERAQQEHALLNCAFWLDNPPPANAAHRNGILSAAYLALSTPVLRELLAPEAIRQSLVDHPDKTGLGSHLQNVLRDLPAAAGFLAPFLAGRYFRKRRIPGFFLHSRSNEYALHYHGEQAPNPQSRILLDDTSDELGVRRARIDLRFDSQDYDSIMRSHRIVDMRLKSLGIGELHYTSDIPMDSIKRQARDGFHQIGGARMSRNPQEGVVDANCRLHAVPNLHVASSAVFPTSGQANPTLTIVALAMRLASRLTKALRS